MSNTGQEKFSKNIFFALATMGAAIGLGGLWRFPSMAYQNGGGSFFIPFIICNVLIGIPLILLEFGLGRWAKGSIAEAFKKNSTRQTWIGWWVLINSFVIVCYYAVVMAWCLQYAIYSINTKWGADTSSFFYNEVLHLTPSPSEWGIVNIFTIVCLGLIWIFSYAVLKKGIKVLSKILLITVPIPFLILLVLATRSTSLPGGMDGVSFFIKPDTSKLLSLDVWSSAASQVILSLSIGMGQMVAYSSMNKPSASNLKPAVFLVTGNFLFSLLSGIAVFATFGAMQYKLGQPVGVTQGIEGPSLAFVTYPAAISALPFAPFWGFLFFFMLVLLGIDSVFAVVEANVTDLKTVFNKQSKGKIVGWFCALSFLGGLFFCLGNGLLLLDIVDHWVGNFAIFSIVVLQCIVFGTSQKIREIALHIGTWMTGRIFRFWRIWISVLVPVTCCVFIITGFKKELIGPYSGYPFIAVLIGGWLVFFLAIIAGIVLSRKHNSTNK